MIGGTNRPIIYGNISPEPPATPLQGSVSYNTFLFASKRFVKS